MSDNIKGGRGTCPRCGVVTNNVAYHSARECAERPGQAMSDRKLSDDVYTAIGWCWAEACASLDRGQDPRTIDCAELLSRAEEDLSTRPAPSPEVERVVEALIRDIERTPRLSWDGTLDLDTFREKFARTLTALDATREDGLDRMIDGGRQEWTMDGQEQDKPAERGEG